jgi:hypothetical protein
MTSSAARTTRRIRIRAAGALLGIATIGMTAAPKPANAWWHDYGWGVGVYVPPVVVAPPVFYAPPPYYNPPAYYAPRAYYAPPARPWIAAHWANGYWIGGHWG